MYSTDLAADSLTFLWDSIHNRLHGTFFHDGAFAPPEHRELSEGALILMKEQDKSHSMAASPIHPVFLRKKLNLQKLSPFGFIQQDDRYVYSADIMDGQFTMTVSIAETGEVSTMLREFDSEDEYILHRIPGATGAFVGRVKEEHETILRAIAEQCFEPDCFTSEDAKNIIQYVQETYQDTLEFLWKQFPNDAIFRRKDTNKWYATLLVLSSRKLGCDSDEIIDILDLRMTVNDASTVIDQKRFFPGYHMNKDHWYTICLDGSVPIEEIYRRIDISYGLAK